MRVISSLQVGLYSLPVFNIPMKISIRLLRFVCGLLMFAMMQGVFAADDKGNFSYSIELVVPTALRSLMENNLDIYRWRGNERMNEEQLQRLLTLAPEQIREFLATEGYYSPQVNAKMDERGGKWVVKLLVDPGEPVRVESVVVNVTGPFDDGTEVNRLRLEQMREEWGLHSGLAFRHAEWESAKRRALNSLLRDRYPGASISNSHATVNPQTRNVALQITLESGPPYTLGELEITGLERYSASLVQRMSPIKPGEPYSQSRLLELQSRLQDSLYFSSVTVTADTANHSPEHVPVVVELTESLSQKLGFGIGMSTDTGVRSLIDYRNTNFLDRAWGLGGTFNFAQKKQTIGSTLNFPLDDQGYRDALSVQYERNDIQNEITQAMVLGAKRSFMQDDRETVYGLRYFAEKKGVAGAGSTRSDTLSPSFSRTQRNVDHALYPTDGYLFTFQVDAAARALLSDQNFLRGFTRTIYFYPLSKNDQLILRGELGGVAAINRKGISSEFLFRAGGDQSVRGYSYQSLGVQEGNAIVGGRVLVVGSAEYVHWFNQDWGGALFFDGGDAADTVRSLLPVYGYGAGARWKSPVGPLNFDLAYGRSRKRVRLHFSVGFNF